MLTAAGEGETLGADERPECRITAADLVASHRNLPWVDYAQMRREADEFFGTEDRIGDGEEGRLAGPGLT